MYLHYHTVISILICFTFPMVHTQDKNECVEFIENNNDSKHIPCVVQVAKENISNSNRLDSELQSKDFIETNVTEFFFLPQAFKFPFINTDNAIDILKTTTTTLNKSIITKAETFEDKKGNEFEENVNLTAFDNTSKLLINTDNKKEADEDSMSTLSFLDKITTSSFFNAANTNNQGAFEILKSHSIKNNQSIEKVTNYMKNKENLNKTMKNMKASSESNSTTDSQTPSNDINLSELVNLSFNDGSELALGQTIDFSISNVASDTEKSNSSGAEILEFTSETCGSLFGKRISFANETTLMEYPWTALLLYNTEIRYHCGGSLITQKYVLTAAHCVAQQFFELSGVRLGEHDITKAKDCAPDLAGSQICASTIDAQVVKIIVHHSYSHLSFKNDIALLRLDKDYFTRSYYPICIPKSEMMFKGTRATVAGWGATEKAVRSSVLLKAEVPIFNLSKCREIYRYSKFNDSTEICASGENEVAVCKGDSGGAIFYRELVRGRDKYFQLGIISLGVRRCGDSRFLPAVFTKLNGFYNWIENNLEH